MRISIYLLLLTFCSSYDTYCQNDIVYDAVNQILEWQEGDAWVAEGKPSYAYLLDKPLSNSLYLNDIDKLFENESIQKYFSSVDKESFIQQMTAYKDFSYDQHKISKKKVLKADELNTLTKGYEHFWKEYETKYGRTGFYEISFPLFSADGSKMLVGVENNLFRLDPHGSVYIFKKEGTKWVLWKSLYGYL